ncbi:hypothetical protein [Mucilaginibacter sp. L3T2-6]|uniref:hypothetical protein n=1 Tax=Mucilaginibacter sp. L3T2-6 TaxID=3062491 RepID=UPI00267761FD|nr:hypothetical protein [Mucilaginibacter sp. L3T2-6]MDO3644720.1 hypothetical protein [Mucilaginibacter sp. L3T2-6]MDV6217172.1 hypothetical protein [Mucilaginibacter sp. L3T2-6]
MSNLEDHQIKGITIKNAILTVVSTASIVASVTTMYYNLKAEIQQNRADRETETRLTNLRLAVLENQVALLQKEVNTIKFPENNKQLTSNTTPGNQHLLTVVK